MLLRVVYSYISATLTNVRGMLIFCDISFERWEIWLCLYCKKVRDVQCPIFIMVVSFKPCNFSAIAPPSRRECALTKSGSMTWKFNLSFFVLACTAAIMWWLSTSIQSSSLATEHNGVDSSPPAAKILYRMWAKAFTGHIVMPLACCVVVWPIRPFFWFDFFRTARFSVRSTSSGELRGIIIPFQKIGHFQLQCFCACGTEPFSVLHNSLGFGIFANPKNKIKYHKDQATNSLGERIWWRKAVSVCFMG